MARDELTLIRAELDALVLRRSLVGLTGRERVRYEELADSEAALLQAGRTTKNLFQMNGVA
jgi:hypothetical protein